jgi:hypothetical protein
MRDKTQTKVLNEKSTNSVEEQNLWYQFRSFHGSFSKSWTTCLWIGLTWTFSTQLKPHVAWVNRIWKVWIIKTLSLDGKFSIRRHKQADSIPTNEISLRIIFLQTHKPQETFSRCQRQNTSYVRPHNRCSLSLPINEKWVFISKALALV